jgi:hypothetical protein
MQFMLNYIWHPVLSLFRQRKCPVLVDHRRFDVFMSPELTDQLSSTARITGLSRGEVFRRAIGLYKMVIDNKNSGGKLLFREANGRIKEIVGLVSNHV